MSNNWNYSPVVKFTGNGATKAFTFNFMWWDEGDILVYIGETLQTSGYTVSSVSAWSGNKNLGGRITFTTAPENGTNITVTRVIDIKRYSEFEESGLFRAAVANDELDHIIAMIQQINKDIDTCLKVDIFSTITPEQYLDNIYSDMNSKVSAAATSATSAANSATSAASSKTAAANSASAAAASQTAAANSATAAAASATQAAARKTEVDTVLSTSGFDTVRDNLEPINTVADNISNVNATGNIAGQIAALTGYISLLQTVANKLSAILAVYDGLGAVVNTSANMGNINKLANLFDINSTLISGGFADTTDYGEVLHGGTATAAASEYGETVSGSDAAATNVLSYFDVFQTCAENITIIQSAATYAEQAANAAQSANAALASMTTELAVINGGTATAF